MRGKQFIAILICWTILHVSAQEEPKWTDKFSLHGYVKYMPSVNFMKYSDTNFDHLIHNRINFRGDLTDRLMLRVELRNRVFFGNTVSTTQPIYGYLTGKDNGEVDLSFLPVNSSDLIISTVIDRAYFNYTINKLEISVGRQRINWGINLLWNTNDLFNAYNFVDFDYQERPGSDALRLHYFTGNFSSVEAAYRPGEDLDHSIIAGLVKFNKWKYDFQLLGANYFTDLALGGGWAGNLKKAGFKGEMIYFHPKNDTVGNLNTFLSSVSIDYSFKNSIYINASFLLNSKGVDTVMINSTQQNLFSGNLSAKNLMPSKFSYFTQVSGSFNPKWGGSLAVIYGQGLNLFLLMPSITHFVSDNIDTDLTGQFYFGETADGFENIGNGVYLRVRYSF